MPSTKGQRHNQRRAPLSVFEDAIVDLNMSCSALTVAMGYSGTSTAAQWRENGEIPYVAAMAIAGLRARKKKELDREDATLVVRVPLNKQEATLQFLDAMGVNYTQI